MVISSTSACAAMVHYFDEQGKIHYINTDVAIVPKEYMDQVKPQLEALKPKAAEPAVPVAPPMSSEQLPSQPADVQYVKVEVITESGCAPCQTLMRGLRQRGIPFQYYNFNYSSAAQEMYTRFSGQSLPLTIINGRRAVTGSDIYEVLKAIESEGGTISSATDPIKELMEKTPPEAIEAFKKSPPKGAMFEQ